MQRRRLLLKLWYFLLIILVVEFCGYEVTRYVADSYRRVTVVRFNADATKWQAVNKVPYAENINKFSREYGVSAQVVASVIQAESSYQPKALSRAGAYGLMQVIPDTWKHVNSRLNVCASRHKGECSEDCYFNPELNIRIGTAYLGELKDRYHGNLALAIAAYNAGPGAVDHYGGIPPFPETEQYVTRIIGYWYDLEQRPLPVPGITGERWHRAQSYMGWTIIVTGLIIIGVAWRIYRYNRSWRWG